MIWRCVVSKQCTLDEFKSYYYREREQRFSDSVFSRVRGGTRNAVVIVNRNTTSILSNVFSICKNCRGLCIYGICQKCSFVTVCCNCGKVKQCDGSWLDVHQNGNLKSHGLCKQCACKLYPEVYSDKA